MGAASGLPIQDILEVGRIALGDHWPDLVVIFDVDGKTAARRLNPLLRQPEFDTDLDRIEMKGSDFHRAVRQGFLDQAQREPQRHLVIDASADQDEVFSRLIDALRRKFE